MSPTEQTKELIFRYWKSWQTQDWEQLRGSLADELEFGGQAMSADAFTEMCKNGSPWTDVSLLTSLFTDSDGALLYEGTDTKSGNRIRVGEFIKVEGGRVKSSIACFGTGWPAG